MKIELVCAICKKSLAISEIKPEDCAKLPNACVQIESPFCKDYANKNVESVYLSEWLVRDDELRESLYK